MKLRTWGEKSLRGLVSLTRRGNRTILWTPKIHMGVGNYLYLWLWADARRQRGLPDRVLLNDTMAGWLPQLPTMQELVIPLSEVRWQDRRQLTYHQSFGDEVIPGELADFSRRRVLSLPALAPVAGHDPERVVVNIRRGDYYSDPVFRSRYAYNIDSYLRTALASISDPVSGLHVVSDEPGWCREHLGWLTQFAPTTFAPVTDGPLANLRDLATAQRLVLTNSTFSYWGGYLSNVFYGDNHHQVIAPGFHARHIDAGRPWQLNPRWHIIEQIPGGWRE